MFIYYIYILHIVYIRIMLMENPKTFYNYKVQIISCSDIPLRVWHKLIEISHEITLQF